MPSVHEHVDQARRALLDAGIPADGAWLDAEVLARHVLGWDRAALLSRGREAASNDFAARYDELVARRMAREPVALILGYREFWSRDFEVTADVLIPRPETELVVEAVIEHARRHPVSTLIDVGTGSGCLAVTLAAHLPSTRVIAIDVSPDALQVAQRNAARHGVAGRIQFVHTDVLDGVAEVADLIVSNPPYVPARVAASLQPEVGGYEPAQALFGGHDGFEVMGRLLASAARNLAPEGRLIMEFGDGQEVEVRALAARHGWKVVRVLDDLQDIARVAILER